MGAADKLSIQTHHGALRSEQGVIRSGTDGLSVVLWCWVRFVNTAPVSETVWI